MERKCVSCGKDLNLVEELIKGYCAECVKTGKSDLENAELNKQIASLVKQPRMIELLNRLKSLAEAAN